MVNSLFFVSLQKKKSTCYGIDNSCLFFGLYLFALPGDVAFVAEVIWQRCFF